MTTMRRMCRSKINPAVKGQGAQKRPALTDKSKLSCLFEGNITITDPGQNFVSD
ncbi:MAG: DUF4280 domain-containing protein [Chitinispirillales bacterium]|jgi:hypothetical protein|nr:DUF4280 domain-containing protein [Chitinispirillales bacterium]